MQRRQQAFTLLEILLVLLLAGTVLAIAMPSYEAYRERADGAQAATDINTISAGIDRFYVRNARYPDTLAEAGLDGLRDPWDQPYRYLNIFNGGKGIKGKVRKDKNLVPINTDYDLYSAGPDGKSRPPLTAKMSRDDIVRASNGRYVGPAEAY